MEETANDDPRLDLRHPSWIRSEDLADEEHQIAEYDLTSSPNDFNVTTINSFIESGAVIIPGFQRNYVWDIKRASKLIESLLIGLPVPQIFLYEESRNRFLVIDGQQRLMTIYYFIKQRFPRKNKRSALRRIFAEHGRIPLEVVHDDAYFSKFDLQLPETAPGRPNRLSGLSYETLGEYRTSFDLRTIRNVIIKQNVPQDDNSSIYEIFNRLNSGGVNLSPQEIRASLFHSDFYSMLYRLNIADEWRSTLGVEEPDIHMRDVEILLRSYAMLLQGMEYKSSMTKFLDAFSNVAKQFVPTRTEYLKELMLSFLRAAKGLPAGAFHSDVGKFNISVFEAVFAAVAGDNVRSDALVEAPVDGDKLLRLKADPEFLSASQKQTTNKGNVLKRLGRARSIFGLTEQHVSAANDVAEHDEE